MNSMGMPELVIVLMIVLTSLLPIAIAVWVLLTLGRIRRTQEHMLSTLQSIDRRLQRP